MPAGRFQKGVFMSEKRVTVWVQRFKDRPTLYLQWLDPETGQRKSKSAKTSEPDEAEDRRKDLEYELNHGKYQEPSKLDWARFRELYQEEYLPGLRPRSQEKYNTVLDVFEEIVNPSKLRSISERTISLFVKGMRERKNRGRIGLARFTIKNYLVALKTALSWALNQNLILSLPRFPKIRVPKKKPQPIPTESFEKLLEKAPDTLWRTYLLCGWWGGLRLSEAFELRWESSDTLPWVDFERNRISLPAEFAKADKDQWIPLHPVLRQALAELPRTNAKVFPFTKKDGRPLPRSAISHRVLAMAKKAGVKLSMHRLRKGFGCRAAKILGQGGAAILHELMRHSSMQVTMDFYANVDDSLQEAIVRMT
jgi:integrase